MKKVRRFFLIFICISIGIIFGIKYTNSKYISAEKIQVFSGVANPQVAISSPEKQIVESLDLNKISYEFSVRNFDENLKQSDVKFEYNIIFGISQENAPIEINLYKKTVNGNEKINLKDNKTLNLEILELGKTENNYIVEVFYNTESTEIMEENLNISIIIQAVQKEVINNEISS